MPPLVKVVYAPAIRIALGVDVPSGKVGSGRAMLSLHRPDRMAVSLIVSSPMRCPASTNGAWSVSSPLRRYESG
ncbi:hypothetical protein [Streptomyces sp. 8N616]|uniref:hypothetical protein n=1 Tax=Streptomyces sp. 8N616 TaxID=3457414 RepID=UPI003FD11C14